MIEKSIPPYEASVISPQVAPQHDNASGKTLPSDMKSIVLSPTARATTAQLSGISRRYLKEAGDTNIKISRFAYVERESSDDTSVHRVNFVTLQRNGVLQVSISLKHNTINIEEL